MGTLVVMLLPLAYASYPPPPPAPALPSPLSARRFFFFEAVAPRKLVSQLLEGIFSLSVQRWIQLNDEATARIMKREEHIEWLRKLFAGWKEARPALRESRRRRDNGGNVQTGQQPAGRTRTATAAQAGGSGDSGQRAKWVRLMMLLRLRERFRCWASFRMVLTRKGIDAMYEA